MGGSRIRCFSTTISGNAASQLWSSAETFLLTARTLTRLRRSVHSFPRSIGILEADQSSTIFPRQVEALSDLPVTAGELVESTPGFDDFREGGERDVVGGAGPELVPQAEVDVGR